MKCIIIDDDLFIIETVKKQLKSLPNVEVLSDFSDPLLAIKFLNSNKVDVIILDVNMPKFNGFDFIESMKDVVPIILITSDKEYAVNAFEYENVVDYVLKPIQLERLEKAIEKVNRLSQYNKNVESNKNNDVVDELYINVNKKLIKIKFDSIYLIEAFGDYINIYTEDDLKHMVHSTLKKIEEKLPKTFFKVHRSYVINLNKMIDIADNTVLIKDKIIPISRLKKSELMDQLNLL